MSIHQPIPLELGSFGIHYIPHLAPVIRDLLLLLDIEVIVPSGQRVMEVRDITRRVQSLPRPDAGLPLARLENEQQRVQSRHHLAERHTQQRVRGYLIRM
jgi:hypothetical protein